MRELEWTSRPRHRVLRRVVLVTASLGAFFRGVSYFPSDGEGPPQQLTYVDWWAPMPVWAGVWVTVAVFLATATVVPALAIPAMSGFSGLFGLWAASYLVSAMTGESPRAWLTGTSLAVLAVFAAILTSLIERREIRSRGPG